MKKYIDIILGMLGILYFSYLKISYGGMAFSEFFLLVGIILILYHFAKNKLNFNKKVKSTIKFVLLIFITTFLIIESIIIFFPKNNEYQKCDYLVILGAAVKNNYPSLTLRGRLDTAINYLNSSGDDCYIVVSGGRGNDEKISEASAMKKYLIEHKIDSNRILIEDKSKDTYENLKYSKEKIEIYSEKSIKNLKIKVVTTDFHSFRAFILSKLNGYKNINFYSSKSINKFIPVYYTREFFATIKTILNTIF